MLPLNRRARVVHVLRTLDIGGTSKTAQIFGRELAHSYADKYETFVLYNATGDLTRFKLFEEAVGSSHMLSYLHEPAGLEILNSLRPDIVHVYRSGSKEWPPKPKQSLLVETNVFGFFDSVNPPDKSLFMSNWLCQAAKKAYGDRDSFDFINNPTDPPATQESFDRVALLAPDLMPPNTTIVGRCGRADDGIYDDISLKAIMLLHNKYPIHYIVVSPSPRMVADLERFGISHTIIPPTIDPVTLSKFYNTLDFYCHARADGETFGNNIAEAMAHGKAVITHVAAPSYPGMGVFQAQTELVQDCFTGRVVEHSIKAYADKIEYLILDKSHRDYCGLEGKKKFLSQLQTTVCVAKLNDVYKDLLSNHLFELRK